MNHLIKKLIIDTLESIFITVRKAHLKNIQKNTPNQTIHERINQRLKTMTFNEMSKQQAMLILNVDPNFTEFTLNEKYQDMVRRNSQDLGGSLYIRSKIHNAYNTLKKNN